MSIFGPPNIDKMKAKRDIKGLIKALGYKDGSYLHDHIPEVAARALGEIKDISAVEPLITLLKDGYSKQQVAALEALGNIGDARAIKPIIDILDFHKDYLDLAASKALVMIGTVAVEPLLARVRRRNVSSDYEKSRNKIAATLLNEIGWQPTNDENGAYYWIALEDYNECSKIGPPATPALCYILERNQYDGFTKSLEERGMLKGMDYDCVTQVLESKEYVRVIEALGRIGDTRAISRLRWFVGKQKHAVPKIIEALGRIGGIEAAEAIIETLLTDRSYPVHAPHQPDPAWHKNEDLEKKIQKHAVDALVSIGSPAVEPLLKFINSREGDIDTRKCAAEALEKIKVHT